MEIYFHLRLYYTLYAVLIRQKHVYTPSSCTQGTEVLNISWPCSDASLWE